MDKPRILVVEDEPAIAETICYALDTDGCTTRWLDSGAEVPACVRAGDVDLLILDIGLPDISGMDLCKEIRRTSSIPIIFLTARSDEIDRVVGLEIGGDDYVMKPFSPRELSARVKAVLRRTRPDLTAAAGREEMPAAKQSRFAVDDRRRQILFDGTLLKLSRYEYNLLALLITHPGRVFSREQLMERAWDEPDASMERTVDAHIKNLRARLREVDPDREIIATHRGVGYSLKEGI